MIPIPLLPIPDQHPMHLPLAHSQRPSSLRYCCLTVLQMADYLKTLASFVLIVKVSVIAGSSTLVEDSKISYRDILKHDAALRG